MKVRSEKGLTSAGLVKRCSCGVHGLFTIDWPDSVCSPTESITARPDYATGPGLGELRSYQQKESPE